MKVDEKLNMTMLCDFYELTMGNGYFQNGMKDRITYFDVFFRRVPDQGGFAIAVHPPGETELADDLLLQGRADFSVETDYTAGSEMEKIVTMLMRRIRASSDVSMAHALQVQRAHSRRGEYVPLNIPLRGGIETEETE